MANTEGIVIEFEGKTLKFDKSVDGIKKALNTLKTQTRAYNKEWQKTGELDALLKKIKSLQQEEKVAAEQVKAWADKIAELNAQGKNSGDEWNNANKKWAMAKSTLTQIQINLSKATELADEFAKTPLEEFNEKAKETGERIKDIGDKAEKLSKSLEGAWNFTKELANSSIEFEDAFASVKKTVDETDATSYEDLQEAILDMSKEVPSTAKEIAEVVAMAGQMGVGADDIIEFTRAMIDMGNSTNVNAKEAAEQIAQIYNVIGKGGDFANVEKTSSAIVELGNNTATTESKIIEMARNIAAASTSIGLSESEMLGLAATLSSLGLDKGGASAISSIMRDVNREVATNGDNLSKWAALTNQSTEEFKDAWKNNVSETIISILQGINDETKDSKAFEEILADLNISDMRQEDTLGRLTNAQELLSKNIELSNNAYEDGNALSEEAQKRYETVASKLKILRNNFEKLKISLGNALLPTVERLIDFADRLTEKLDNMSPQQKEFIAKLIGFVGVLAPILSIISSVIGFIATLTTALPTLTTMFTAIKGVLIPIFTMIKTAFAASPVAVIGLLVAAIIALYQECEPFRELVDKLFEKAKQLWDKFKETQVFKDLQDWFGKVGEKIQAVIDKVKKLIEKIKELAEKIKEYDMYGGYGSYADMMRNRANGGSGGFGALASGGYASGGITLNASFNITGTTLDESTARRFADMLTDRVNENLGGLV